MNYALTDLSEIQTISGGKIVTVYDTRSNCSVISRSMCSLE